jgi:cell cycle checkpoint control protein RAD9A
MYIRSLLSVFRTRLGGDPSRERDKETTIDRCEVTIEDEPGVRSRMVARIVSRNGKLPPLEIFRSGAD